MLRLLVLMLLLANAAFFAWGRGYLQPWGLGPVQQSEPHRLGQQVRPGALRLLRGGEAGAIRDAGAEPNGNKQQTETSR